MGFQHKEIIGGILAASLIISGIISYTAFISPSADIPEKLKQEAENNLLALVNVQANQIAGYLGRTETVIEATAKFASQMYNNPNIEDLESYYHDNEVNQRLGLPEPPGLQYNSKYQQDITPEASAFKIAPRAFNDDFADIYNSGSVENVDPLNQVSPELKQKILTSSRLDHIWKILYESFPENLWLYMGFEEGFHRTYPYHSLSRSYDPTIRPWYVGAVTGAKDVVIIIDKSGSMGGDAMENAKKAAKQVVGTLGPNDRFTVIAFSGSISTYSSNLEIASGVEKELVASFINNIDASGSTDINGALEKGLSILQNEGRSDRSPLIIFMTDGEPTSGITDRFQILQNIQEKNIVDAKIFMFGLGANLDRDLIDDLSEQNDGVSVYVQDSSELSVAMSRYAQFFTSNVEAVLSWSFPYIDAAGSGLIVSASKAVIVNETIIGVVSADITFDSLVDFMKEFSPSENGRAFVFDVGGTTVIHDSFVDLPPRDWQEDAVRVPIGSFETDSTDFEKLIQKVQLGENVADVIFYGKEARVVAFSKIGKTSMIFGVSAPVLELVDEDAADAIKSEQARLIPVIWTSIILGGVLALLVYNKSMKSLEGEN